MTLSRVMALILALTIVVAPVHAQQHNSSGDPVYTTETADGFTMIGDLVIARPLLVGATLIGTALFVISLPFSLASGSVEKTAESLIFEPGREAFVRCLGCTQSGYGVEEDQ